MEDGRRRRAGALTACAFAVGLLHLALLGGLRWTWDAPVNAVGAVQVRSVVAPVAAATVKPPAVAAVSAPPRLADRREPPARPRRPAAPAADRMPTPAAVATASPVDADDDEPPPVYRTQLPPPLKLRYDVRRGLADGTAELHWRRDAEGYALDWQVRVGDVAVLTQSSRGGIDAAGVAPLRFVDQRSSRAAAAANFRRDIGLIAFSRKAADAPLVPGAQDRLSWLLQLGAIVAAEPGLRRAGADLRMTVAGAGGEVAVWRFRCQGEETVATDSGATPALHFVREPHGPYETRAEVWLDPRGGRYLPLQANWKSGPADDGFELRLRDAVDLGTE